MPTVRQLRPSAFFNADTDIILVGAAAATEIAAFNRLVPIGQPARTELELRPGTVYRLYTGVALPDVRHPLELSILPTASAIRSSGLCIYRAEFLEGELTLLVSVQRSYQLNIADPLAELAIIGQLKLVPAPPVAPPRVELPVANITPPTPPAPDRRPAQISDAEKQRRFMESEDDVQVEATPIAPGTPPAVAPKPLAELKGQVQPMPQAPTPLV